jgi:hypothetical protein
MEDFQRGNNLQPTGRLDSSTMQALDLRAGTSRAQARSERDRAYMGGGAVGTGAPAGRTGSMSGGGANPGNTGSMMAPSTPSTGPGGPSNVGSGNQPATGGTSQNR